MGIEKRQPGAAKAAAAAGTAIGESQKAIREQAIAAQKQSQQATLKAREASEQRAMQWEVDKMQFRSQQDFEQELRRNQFSYDRENRAKEWQIEKMTLASQADFEREERKRNQSITEGENGLAALKRYVEAGNGTWDDPAIRDAKIKYQFQAEGSPEGAPQFADQGVQERAAGRYQLAVEAARRSEEVHEERLTIADRKRLVALAVEQRAEGRFEMATETEKRAKERFEEREPPGRTERQKLTDIVGKDLADVLNLAELREEAAGVTGQTSSEVTPEELKSIGTQAAYERGKKLGYWN